jgi:glutamate formiminotransferase/formiminotetrahydrofolate cyclodeaminase
VGEELGVAVYLYGEAATRPGRKKLSAIRKGQYELWKEEIGKKPEREPDFGPAVPRPWGATVIGARPFLIAYNLYLNSDDAQIADQIAREIRFIGGGLRYVQAKGFLVEGQAQVSMNLTHFSKTPIYRVQELVRREAARYGLSIAKAELIGMIPQTALLDAARYYLQLHDMEDGQILELRLQDEVEENGDVTPAEFVEATASATPTPGGGSVGALAGALAAALTEMVAGLTAGRKKYAAVSEAAEQIGRQAAELRAALTQAINEDAAAFEAVLAAYRNKELGGAEKEAAIEQATIGAAQVPLRVAKLSLQAAQLAAEIAHTGNINAVSDAAAGALMAEAAVQAAGLNVLINAVSIKDRALAEAMRAEVAQLESDVHEAAAAAKAAAAERGGL